MNYLTKSLLFFLLLTTPIVALSHPSETEKHLTANYSDSVVYELRTYTTYDGKLDDLHKRFEDHTLRLFEKHGMINLMYWTPLDPDKKDDTLIYILKHESREAAEASWDAFRNDPEWQAVYEESHQNGPIVKQVESVFMEMVPYSPVKE